MACKIEGNSEICGPAGGGSVTPMNSSCCPSVGPECRSRVVPPMPCTKKSPIVKNPNPMELWVNRKFVCDKNGSGIQPMGYGSGGGKNASCCTPLSAYQASHGELARKLLTKETCLPKYVQGPPPSMMSTEIMPPCRGYYRKYECLRPQDMVPRGTVNGKPIYPTPFQRYWQAPKLKNRDIICLAGTNVELARKVRRRIEDGTPCF